MKGPKPRPPSLPPGLAQAFGLAAPPQRLRRVGAGLIHATYVASYRTAQGDWLELLHQRVNTGVFADPHPMMENIRRVTEHLRQRLRREGEDDADRHCLRLVTTRQGEALWRDPDGGLWRAFRYISRSRSFQSLDDPVLVRRAAGAFARFSLMLADLPGPRLAETLPGFHDTPRRLRELERAADAAPAQARARVAAEIEAIGAREATARLIADAQARGAVPERVVHNDTKVNNVLFDDDSLQTLCVVDLDTVMPGSLLHDFGDLARSVLGAGSDEGLSTQGAPLALPLFAALVEGYLGPLGPELSPAERELLPLAGQVITLELATRFLTDHLQGDRYFRTAHPGQNLERCRAQLRLLRAMEREQAAMTAIVERVFRSLVR